MPNHLLIAGTGRAGTSLLVRCLAELGLETQIANVGDAFWWSEDANAGLEDFVHHNGRKLSYVVKSPWLYEFIDEVLEREDITIDGVILPVRNLAEAASSRTILEMQNIHRNNTWMAGEARTWETWALTPGGVIYSLNPLDEARLLAVGFHHLVERLANAGVPIYLLAFPRFSQDPEYFYSILKGCLPSAVTVEDVKAVHAKVVEPEKIRVTAEISQPVDGQPLKSPEGYPALEELDNIALRRELEKLRSEHNSTLAACSSATNDAQTTRSELVALQEQVQALQYEIASKYQEVEERRQQVEAFHQSTSWRAMAPLRTLAGFVRKK
ncbi:hypothetical protein [Phyllobacterium lublinensis]|uniref:hypothetical protein n=1 Tax=Phyllobacterium lublinensis TaxID=2875708 RepID=UPI001CC91F52|nr:hypothetical protein [Phyllobacterium sp. 2063]MBZ9653568.1 hypothetical protein [Phyllobacterium sp. 2063]